MSKPEEENDNILKDGERMRVPLVCMDALQRCVLAGASAEALHDGLGNPAGHKPGFIFGGLTAEERRRQHDCYIEYCEGISDAWRAPPSDLGQGHSSYSSKPSSDDRAYDDYITNVENAWRLP